MIYQWKHGAHIRGSVSAQAAGERLEALRQEHGQLTAEIAVEDARPEDAPLHPAFEWDDAVAAENYRLVQAREVIRSVVVVRQDNADANPIRAFVVIGDIGEQEYTSTYVALADPAMRQQVLSRALRELQQWERKYQELEELAGVLSAAREIRQKQQKKAA